MCLNVCASLQMRECVNRNCTYMHIKGTRKTSQFQKEQTYGAKNGQPLGLRRNTNSNFETPETTRSAAKETKRWKNESGDDNETPFLGEIVGSLAEQQKQMQKMMQLMMEKMEWQDKLRKGCCSPH